MSSRLLPIVAVAIALTVIPVSYGQTLRGSLRHDVGTAAHGEPEMPDGDDVEPEMRRSVALSAAMSALLPGSGQTYAGARWWRSLLYGAIEAAGWVGFGLWRSSGNRATDDFQRYADAHWDVTRYVEWISANYVRWHSDAVDHAAAGDALARIYRSRDMSIPPWERIDFDALNQLERAIRGGFSHTLPRHGEQQYYEEIGKYVQYRSGWDDHPFGGDSLIFDPTFVTAANQDYTLQRQRANDLLARADYAIALLALNHLVSMLDAGITAHNVNLSISPGVEGMLEDGILRNGFRLNIAVAF